MAITGIIKTWRLHRKTDKKQRQLEEWKAYYKKVGKSAMPLARWKKEGKPSGEKKGGKKIAYYGQGRETADAKLRRIKRGK